MTEQNCEICGNAVGVGESWMIQQRCEFWDDAVTFLGQIMQWYYEIWDVTVAL